MLLMIEKVTRGGICQAIRRCAAANNKYMKEYKKEKDSNNLFGWTCLKNCLQRVLNGKKMPKLNEKFLKKDSDKRYILEADVKHTKRLDNFHNDLPFLLERMKI